MLEVSYDEKFQVVGLFIMAFNKISSAVHIGRSIRCAWEPEMSENLPCGYSTETRRQFLAVAK